MRTSSGALVVVRLNDRYAGHGAWWLGSDRRQNRISNDSVWWPTPL